MQIDLVPDRVTRRPDPVEAKAGVFAHLGENEMSASEQARLAKAVPADPDMPVPAEIPTQAEPAVKPKQWSPKAILRRLTDLYAVFTKPEKHNG